MPRKGYVQTEEHKQKIAESLKKAHIEGRHTASFSKGHKILGFLGKKHTEEWKQKQSNRMKENNPMTNDEVVARRSKAIIKNGTFSGKNNNNWRGGRSHYRGADWHKQRKLALERDQYTCQRCGAKQENLERELTVHHILPYHDGGTNDLTNLITLCMSCHFRVEPRFKRNEKND